MTKVSEVMAAVYDWASANIGDAHVFTLTASADFVTGNQTNGVFDGDAMSQVTFATSHAATLQAVATSIQQLPAILKAIVTGPRQITCTGYDVGNEVIVSGPVVTGGATQPTFVKADVVDPYLVPVIYADQNAPRPNGTYCVIRFQSFVHIGQEENRGVNPDTYLAEIGGMRRCTVMVDVLGPNAVDECSKAHMSLAKPSVLTRLYDLAGVALNNKAEMINLTNFLETETLERCTFDFFISFAQNVEDDLGVIEIVDLEETFHDAVGGDLVINQTISA